MQIKASNLASFVASMSYQNNGDDKERKYHPIINDTFSNSEIFWKRFVVPSTNRIDEGIFNVGEKIKFRVGVTNEIQEISCFHYSVFMNLIYSHTVLESTHLSIFENFYTHMASVCDSAEELFSKIYLLILECNILESEVLQRLSKKKFMIIAQQWYDEHYSSTFEHYLSKGKHVQVKLLGRENLLEEYFQKDEPWKEFKRFAQSIRQYRNAIVHNYQIGSIHDTHRNFFVPKKEKIGNYKKWNQVFNAVQDEVKFKRDFILREEQMHEDLKSFKIILQNLWEKPINDFTQLFYSNKNDIILKKFNLEIQD